MPNCNRPAMIFIVSPSAHYPSHNWPNTAALARALMRRGRPVHLITFSSTPDAIPPDLQGKVTAVYPSLPRAWRRTASGQWETSRWGGWLNLYE